MCVLSDIVAMNWKNGCVAILKDNNEPIGTGFVVSATGIIVTCDHLLRPQPDGTISLRFTANNQVAQATVIDEWNRGRDEEDITFLRLSVSLPADVLVLPLIRSHPLADRHFRCWGYPRVKGFTGLGADGHVVAQVQQNGRFVRPTIPEIRLSKPELFRQLRPTPQTDDTDSSLLKKTFGSKRVHIDVIAW